jgi:serine protease Do
MADFRNSWPIIFGFIAIGIIVGVVLTTGVNIDNKSFADQPVRTALYTEGETVPEAQDTPPTAGSFNPSSMFVNVVKSVRPSIVTVYTTTNVDVPNNPWHRFFRDFGLEDQDPGQPRQYQQGGLGSGIIISEDGYIVTNNHVIENVDELTVRLVDEREFEAKVIGTDPLTDVALIKIDASSLATAVLGNSDNIQIGEWVLAIGSPLRLNFTVTAGIVSALGRDINIIQRDDGYGIENFIQTDAAINPGNSGGALINYKGEVIGVNSAIATPTGNYIGYGFALPINLAKNVIDDFIKYGEVRRGYIGVRIEAMNQLKAKGVGLDKPTGVFVTDVLPGRAAEKAGLEAGDVILEVNGTKVNRPNQLQAKIGSYDPGDKVSVLIWRDGERKTYRITLQGRDGAIPATARTEKKIETKNIDALGLRVRDLRNNELNQVDLEYGIMLENVASNSPAFDEGLRNGDVIFQIDKKAVKSASWFTEYIEDLDRGDIIKVQMRRGNRSGTNFDRLVFIQIPK